MTTRPRRVAVTAPSDRGEPVARTRSLPASAALGPGTTERARGLRRAQLRRAVITLCVTALMLAGLPVLLRVAPDLAQWRAGWLPLGWVAVAWLPYPLLVALAWWHLRRAEHIERADDRDRADDRGRADRP